MFDIGRSGQGIVHVIGPELGITQPGMLIVCADSHTCTHGGLGALAFGVGASEATHVLATQAIRQRRPRTMRVRFEGVRATGIDRQGSGAARDRHAGRGAPAAVAPSSGPVPLLPVCTVEERLTLCNMSIEMGAKIGMIAPDDATFEYVAGPSDGADGASCSTAAVAYWRTLAERRRTRRSTSSTCSTSPTSLRRSRGARTPGR